ncbi:futalosine hydrolase [Malonomonas rubra DSM 5091]|uniref:Futalosine hydrolase n=1 Tax=Malonomonas rubra DSM 5091 TaxID=1122189 RepID=A0A1M6L7E8_MALRU|nr:futalosine hydrolase [Malonomonas rubra]SHJ66959.1 futalosine hydrolase [Malonomonas rubra DSM 5091]
MLIIIAAVPLETNLLRQELKDSRTEQLGSCCIEIGTIYDQDVLIAHSGVGQTAMSLQLTRLLERYPAKAVLLCGCGGSYPDSTLRNGELAIATAEFFGDLGVSCEEDFIHLSELEIPQNPELELIVQRSYLLPSPLVEHARKTLPQALCGTFVTVNSCSGCAALSNELQQRSGGICENMEGAAAAQVCAEYNLPLLELRGISNPTGSRDPQQWNIPLGAEAAQQGLLEILRHWPEKQEESCNS